MHPLIMDHSGGRHLPATFADIAEVEPPVATSSYTPLRHADIARLILDRLSKEFGLTEDQIESGYALRKDGQRCFGVHRFHGKWKDKGYSIGWRNSHDCSMQAALAMGLYVFCCTNLALRGDSLTVFRKHVGDAWAWFKGQVFVAVAELEQRADQTALDLEKMGDTWVSKGWGYERVGLARGLGILTPTQANVAFRLVQKPERWKQIENEASFESFGVERNGQLTELAVYNACTTGMKVGDPMRSLDRHTGLHRLFGFNGA